MITIITAPESYNLTTVASLKSMLNITDSASDTKLGDCIARASSIITNYCNRQFAQTRVSEKIRVNGRDFTTIQLENAPINTLHSFKYLGDDVASTDYSTDELCYGRILSGENLQFFYSGRLYSYSAEYTFGYVLPSFTVGIPNLPSDLEYAALQIAKMAFLTSDKHPNIKMEDVPDVYRVAYAGGDLPNTTFNAILSNDVQMVLRKYKRVLI